MIFPEGNDLVNDLDRGIASPLGLADFLRVTAALLDEIDYVEHFPLTVSRFLKCFYGIKRMELSWNDAVK